MPNVWRRRCRVSTDAAGLGAVDSYRELRGVRNRRASRDGRDTPAHQRQRLRLACRPRVL